MDWAKDQVGNLVHASERGLFSYGLSCPTCGEPVRRRAGPQRRPHFAHYSHSAKPDCENYYPSWGIAATSGAPRVSSNEEAVVSGVSSLHGGLFFERADHGAYSLYLKLPQLRAGTGNVGVIEIRSGLGVRTYTVPQLFRPRLVPVVPQLPLAEVIAVGDLNAVGETIRTHVGWFQSSGNYFRVGDVGGRLLAPNEPLEWGERYLVVTQQIFGSVPEGFGLRVESQEEWCGWNVYEVVLPVSLALASEPVREDLFRFLGRSIKAPRPRAYFVDPPPHHIEPDGTNVFPEITTRIVLRRTERSDISIESTDQTDMSTTVTDLGDEWVEITSVGPGSFAVVVNGRVELLGRIGECDLFQPRGVRVVVGDRVWEMFEAGLGECIQQYLQGVVRIECPSVRVADYLDLPQGVWVRDGKSYTTTGVPFSSVSAENFGAFFLAEPDAKDAESPAIDAQTRARLVWLEGLIATHCGPEALMRFREQWRGSSPAAYLEGTLREKTWLYPYLWLSRFD